MDNGLASKDFEESLIVQAHEFFQLQVRKWLQDATGPIEHRIDALEAAATSMLQMVVIDLGSQDDPNLIFKPELPISNRLGPSKVPSSTRAILVLLTDAVNHPIERTEPSVGVVS